MKKYFTLMILAVLGGLFVMSCDRTDTVVTEDNDTYPVMKDVTGTFTNGNTYTLSQSLNIANSDVFWCIEIIILIPVILLFGN